ncbi:hypothetical protein HNQ93_001011 [Hymenobacter luteus]|uniref:STAS/SEC14 domain-containing protein n=2 Tax=Hymenobacter TaxID=89966 RepID=A0A7W9SYN4_9BACT|nr:MULTISPECIES: hypothetical protein [Hymenobacter]MBB4599509.1 hypothetical protein [Hymenobacter latericoloratus]MBB6058181.1 hypothetical protein [Hymenobacter luteus]
MKQAVSTPVVYFESAAGTLLEDPAGFIRAIWGSNAQQYTTADAQEFFSQMMAGMQRRGWSRMFVDQTHMRPFTAEEQRWISQEWLPRAVTHGGYRHGAVVVSPNVMVRLATAYITTQVLNLSLIYRSFDSAAAAQAWLLEQPISPGK